jgi:hypothetical protein
MKFATWEAISKRLTWYEELLLSRAREWTEERFAACTDRDEILKALHLSARIIRHRARMDRHMDRAIAHLNPKGGMQ